MTISDLISDYCNIRLARLINLEKAYGYYSKERVAGMADHLNSNILGDPRETMEWARAIDSLWNPLFEINVTGERVQLKLYELQYIWHNDIELGYDMDKLIERLKQFQKDE